MSSSGISGSRWRIPCGNPWEPRSASALTIAWRARAATARARSSPRKAACCSPTASTRGLNRGLRRLRGLVGLMGPDHPEERPPAAAGARLTEAGLNPRAVDRGQEDALAAEAREGVQDFLRPLASDHGLHRKPARLLQGRDRGRFDARGDG